jgi:hypothetical protein
MWTNIVCVWNRPRAEKKAYVANEIVRKRSFELF